MLVIDATGLATRPSEWHTLFQHWEVRKIRPLAFSTGSNTEGDNTRPPVKALFSNTSVTATPPLGLLHLEHTSGSGNIGLGSNAGENVTTLMTLSVSARGANVDTGAIVDNPLGHQSGGSQAVYVNSLGKLGQMVSAQRFKDDIKPMDKPAK